MSKWQARVLIKKKIKIGNCRKITTSHRWGKLFANNPLRLHAVKMAYGQFISYRRVSPVSFFVCVKFSTHIRRRS